MRWLELLGIVPKGDHAALRFADSEYWEVNATTNSAAEGSQPQGEGMHASFKAALALALLLGTAAAPSHGQPGTAVFSDSLRVWQSPWCTTGFKYQHGAEKGDVGFAGARVKQIVHGNEAALREAEAFARFQVPTFYTSIASAIAIGFGLGNENGELLYVGIGGLAISIAFDQIGYSHLRKSVRIYNAGK